MKKNKISRSLEDYLEAIHILTEENKPARTSVIASMLGVSKASVSGALKNLARLGLIHYEPYSFITLTDKGKTLGDKIHERHNVLKDFFADVLGIPLPSAEEAACSIEHSVNEEILEKLVLLIKTVDENRSLFTNLNSTS